MEPGRRWSLCAAGLLARATAAACNRAASTQRTNLLARSRMPQAGRRARPVARALPYPASNRRNQALSRHAMPHLALPRYARRPSGRPSRAAHRLGRSTGGPQRCLDRPLRTLAIRCELRGLVRSPDLPRPFVNAVTGSRVVSPSSLPRRPRPLSRSGSSSDRASRLRLEMATTDMDGALHEAANVMLSRNFSLSWLRMSSAINLTHWIGQNKGPSSATRLADGQLATAAAANYCKIQGQVTTMGSWQHWTFTVSPFLYGDSKTHFYTLWTMALKGQAATIPTTKCPGFQPEGGASIVPGAVIDAVTQLPNGVKQKLSLKLVKDSASGDWLLHYGLNKDADELIGRFPKSIFTGLADKVTTMKFGGVVAAGGGQSLVPWAAASFRPLLTLHHLPTSNSSTAAARPRSLVTWQLGRVMTDSKLYPITTIANGAFSYGGPS
ncbi:hypothetical protein U9M48_010060 [Paspalum notatum var. saurae]|uniref:Neprosin PEP catalytic domain-containing protein n=1 Tax=Paspalum notatum var. saurae TaxID=547442 RepID=A0AAQ3WG51_PASNO